jgi:aminoglycoside 3-N-acetyltransferase
MDRDVPGPATRDSIARHLGRIGLGPGDTVLVHASMRSIGWVCGGATAVVAALLEVVGADGTVVTPAQTLDNRDPSRWAHAPVPERWWPVIRENLLPFDPAVTPSTGMGAVAERIRTWPGAARSAHPLTSFAAVGSGAADLMAGHALTSLLGEESPLARLDETDARVLLLGVGFDKCTAFHLAEYRIPSRSTFHGRSVVMTAAGRQWITYESIDLDDRDFGRLGADFEAKNGSVVRDKVGAATSRLFPLRAAVTFATAWMPRNRPRAHTLGADERGNR